MVGHLDSGYSLSIAPEIEALKLQFVFHEEEIIKNLNNGLVPVYDYAGVGSLLTLHRCPHICHCLRCIMDSWRDELCMQDRLSQRVIIVCVNNMNKWMDVN
ncbi:hypothetical protein Scep_010831 [Stephania cephalantha]|uniref:Uncharacterized protein n=1 Tax=Stephania cephalantha TaxID=152367 RepID=A0AAP0JY39_9MAGN